MAEERLDSLLESVDLRRALKLLRPEWRTALVLDAEGFTSEAIAGRLRAKPATVRKWIERAKDSLQKRLS